MQYENYHSFSVDVDVVDAVVDVDVVVALKNRIFLQPTSVD